MPTKTLSRHRSRPSIDRVVELLADLDENQVSLLLEDLNNTAPSNIAVAEGIEFFDPNASPRIKRFFPRRRKSTRVSSAPTTSSYDAPMRPKTAAASPQQQQAQFARTPRRVKRISRPVPMLPSISTDSDLRELLAAFLSDKSLSPSSSAFAASSSSSMTSSAQSSPAASRKSSTLTVDGGADEPWLDLLEPSPMRIRDPIGRTPRPRGPASEISGIFEVLGNY